MNDVYLIKKETLTNIADETKTLVGETETITPQEVINHLKDTNTEVVTQADLIAQIKEAANNLPAAGSGDSSEDLEALGALCDWQITTNSESVPTITVINHHPSYYLRCDIDDVDSENYEEMVISPSSSASVILDHPIYSDRDVFIQNVRWTANGT